MQMAVADARQRFAAARVARMATLSETGRPHLVPVTFAVIVPFPGTDNPRADLEEQAALIVFAVDHKPKATTALRRLDNIRANPRVAFLVDHYADDWDRLWWVRADAEAAIVDGGVRDSAIAALRTKYPQYERVSPAGVVIGAAVTGWSGWQAAP